MGKYNGVGQTAAFGERKATGAELARVAEALALTPFHGKTDGSGSNISPLIAHIRAFIRLPDGYAYRKS